MNDHKNLCACKLRDLTGQGSDPIYDTMSETALVREAVLLHDGILVKHTRGQCIAGAEVADEVLAELAALRQKLWT
jgi:hypothetical protein